MMEASASTAGVFGEHEDRCVRTQRMSRQNIRFSAFSTVLQALGRLARAESSATRQRGVVLSPPIVASEGS